MTALMGFRNEDVRSSINGSGAVDRGGVDSRQCRLTSSNYPRLHLEQQVKRPASKKEEGSLTGSASTHPPKALRGGCGAGWSYARIPSPGGCQPLLGPTIRRLCSRHGPAVEDGAEGVEVLQNLRHILTHKKNHWPP